MWMRGRAGIKDSGLGVKDRRYVISTDSPRARGSRTSRTIGARMRIKWLTSRYVLWALARFSQGDAPADFVEPPKPAKKFRGWVYLNSRIMVIHADRAPISPMIYYSYLYPHYSSTISCFNFRNLDGVQKYNKVFEFVDIIQCT